MNTEQNIYNEIMSYYQINGEFPEPGIQDISDPISLEILKNYLSDSYYGGNQLIDDATYDEFIDFYSLEPFEVLADLEVPVQEHKKTKLPTFMPSLNKIKPNQRNEREQKTPCNVIITPKIDGMSCLLDDQTAYTKGSSITNTGFNITEKIRHLLPGVYNVSELTKNYFIRGEIVMLDSVFNKKYSTTYANPRNLVAGILNSKNNSDPRIYDMSIIFYELISRDPNTPCLDSLTQLNLLNQYGYPTVPYELTRDVSDSHLSNYIVSWKKSLKYAIDGIVVTYRDLQVKSIRESENPKYSIAFKVHDLVDQACKTVIKSLVWKISNKAGNIIPVAIIEPVNTGGVVIAKVSCYNVKYVIENQIMPGQTIYVIRAGDVIPKIIKFEPVPHFELSIPYHWEFNENKTHAVLIEETDSTLIAKNLVFFRRMNTSGLGKGLMQILFENNIKSLDDLYSTDVIMYQKIIGPVQGKKIFQLLHSLRDRDGVEVLAALDILGIGHKTCIKILQTIPDLFYLSTEELKTSLYHTPSIGEKTTITVMSNIETAKDFITHHAKYFPKLTEIYCTESTENETREYTIKVPRVTRPGHVQLLSVQEFEYNKPQVPKGLPVISHIAPPGPIRTSMIVQPMKDSKTIVFSGGKQLAADIIQAVTEDKLKRFVISDTINKSISYVISDQKTVTNKTEFAKKHGIPIVSYNEFREILFKEFRS
jgi:NAD-dependent DNA ligase